jgi:phosphoribosyl 1,2-cyclic phosphate phosphodiesterase
MEIVFLGTGSAWSLPEYSCACAICSTMNKLGEYRSRTSLLVIGSDTILVDCGPDLRSQMVKSSMKRPDAVLITHEHGDHYLGLDDLLAFRRSTPKDSWKPIPIYATEQSWQAIELRFGYLVGSLIEKRVASPGQPLEGLRIRVTPFKTFHGPSVPGAVGYVFEDETPGSGECRVVYTSDLVRVEEDTPLLEEPDVLIIQTHWLNEPRENRPHHLSFQRAMDYIRRWQPKSATYLVHISAGDRVEGDPCNNFLKKLEPLSPLVDPSTKLAYPVPRCQAEWQDTVERICKDYQVPLPVRVASDGLRIRVP